MKNKKFLIIGNGNAVTYKEIFPLIKENKMWLGSSKGIGGKMTFIVPKSYKGKYVTEINGECIAQINNACWFTNIDHNKRHFPLDLFKRYNNENFPKYDNYKGIECSKTINIPMDYDGIIGVPITFLDKYCLEQFEIIGIDRYVEGNTMPNKRMHINGKEIYARILIRKKK